MRLDRSMSALSFGCYNFRETKIGRIDYSSPLSGISDVITLYGACFYVAKVLDEYEYIDKMKNLL